jgi:hypothetical protein
MLKPEVAPDPHTYACCLAEGTRQTRKKDRQRESGWWKETREGV